MICRFALLLAAASCALTNGGIIEVGSLGNLVTASGVNKESPVYTAFDDASWGITKGNLSSILGDHTQKLYDRFMKECIQGSKDCKSENDDRMYQNAVQPAGMVNYTKTGFKKIRAPPKLFELLKQFWDLNKDKARIEYNDETAYHNSWEVPTTILMTENDTLIGGGWNLSAAVWNAARDVLEDWTGQKLAGSSVYGIRVYHNQSILTPHVDRLPLVSSAIINVAQDLEEDWPLEVYGHDGKATNVSMAAGDMVLYESHSVIHGRPFPLNGKFYANIFVHFQTMGDIHSKEPLPAEGSLPPYVIPGSAWEQSYWEEFPRGWTLLTDVDELVRKGDLYTLKYVAQREVEVITDPTKSCAIMELAILNKHIDILEFLWGEMDFDVNMVCQSRTPLDIAKANLSPADALIAFVKEMGGISYKELAKKSIEHVPRFDYRCDVIRAALRHDNLEVFEFLFEEMQFDINTVCGASMTPLDILINSYGEDEEPDEETDPSYAFFLEHDAVEYMTLEEDMDNSIITDNRCVMIKAAVRYDSLQTFDFLFDVMNYDINMVCDGETPMDMVADLYEEDHANMDYFQSYGGKTYGEIADLLKKEVVSSERCKTMATAIRSGNTAGVEFLLSEMSYDIKMKCEGKSTLLDIATKTGKSSIIAFFSDKKSRSFGSKFSRDEL